MADPNLVSLFDAALRGIALALLLMLAGALWRDRARLPPPSRAGVAMALGLCVQVVGSTPRVEAQLARLWQVPLVAVSVGNAVLFWILAQALFDDEFELRGWHIAAWLAAAALGGLNCAFVFGSASIFAPLAIGLQRAVPLACAVLAALAALRHWRDDLIDQRRRLRGFIVITGVAYTLATLAARIGSEHGRLSATSATFDIAALTVIVAVVAVRLLRLGHSELFPASAPRSAAAGPEPAHPAAPEAAVEASAPAPDPAEERLAQALHRAMCVDRLYRTEELSIAGLAAKLAVPEYRLRRLINQRLGHRNFNAYINAFRLEDARAALADPARRELPILSIALDAGFQSIGPFNRAFKAATGLTPSDFRRAQLADS